MIITPYKDTNAIDGKEVFLQSYKDAGFTFISRGLKKAVYYTGQVVNTVEYFGVGTSEKGTWKGAFICLSCYLTDQDGVVEICDINLGRKLHVPEEFILKVKQGSRFTLEIMQNGNQEFELITAMNYNNIKRKSIVDNNPDVSMDAAKKVEAKIGKIPQITDFMVGDIIKYKGGYSIYIIIEKFVSTDVTHTTYFGLQKTNGKQYGVTQEDVKRNCKKLEFTHEQFKKIPAETIDYPDWVGVNPKNTVENLMGEIWNDIDKYNNMYQISNKGRFKNLNMHRLKNNQVLMIPNWEVILKQIDPGLDLRKDGRKVFFSVFELAQNNLNDADFHKVINIFLEEMLRVYNSEKKDKYKPIESSYNTYVYLKNFIAKYNVKKELSSYETEITSIVDIGVH